MDSWEIWVFAIPVIVWAFFATFGWIVCAVEWSRSVGRADEQRRRLDSWERHSDEQKRRLKEAEESIREHRRAAADRQARLDAVTLAASLGPGHWPVAHAE